MKFLIHIALLVPLLPTICFGEEKLRHIELTNPTGVEALSYGLRDLLSQEMQAIQRGMMSIIPAYISGNWIEIETIAREIKNSFVLKKNLTENQVKELHSILPPDFFEKDQRFHYLAGMLEHAAKNRKKELINFYFSEMNEACVSCHMVFAIHKFPALESKTEGRHSH